MTKVSQAKNAQNFDKFELIYLDNTDIDEKWSVIFEHATNYLSFGFVRVP